MKKEIIFEKIENFWKKDLSKIFFRDKKIDLNLKSRKAISIIWPRRAWKTFFCFQVISELIKKWVEKEKIIYFNLEDERIKPFSAKDLNLILEVYFENFSKNLDEKIYLFLDEIQEIEWWESFVRRILDETNIEIFLTWSSSKMLSSEITTWLRWRVISYEILPLNFTEILKFKKFELKKYFSENEKFKFREIFNNSLKYWFFPEIVIENNEEIKTNILQNYFDVIFYKDVIERWKIKQIAKAKVFRRFLTNHNTKLVSFKNLAENVNIEETTCLNWYNNFSDAFFVNDLKKFDFSLKVQEKSKKKIYLIDNWFYNSIFWYKIENFWINFEHLIYLELRKKWFKENEDLFYYNIDWYEIDFVILKDEKIIPIQVCYDISDKKTFKREIKSLTKILEKYKNIKKTYLVVPFKNEEVSDLNVIDWIEIIDFKEFLNFNI